MKTTHFFYSTMIVVLILTTFLSACKSNSTNAEVDPDAPVIFSKSPLNDEENVVRNKIVDIVFDQAMNPTTINNSTITMRQGATNVTGSVEFSGTTAKFIPGNSLNAQSEYTVIVSRGAKSLTGVGLASDSEWKFKTGGTNEQLDVVDLGTAGNYVVLARTAINNTPSSFFTGDLGLSPMAESFITGFSQITSTGFSTSDQVSGRIYASDMDDPTPTNLITAVENMATAYDNAEDRSSTDFVDLHIGELDGDVLSPGLYKWTKSVLISGTLTFSGGLNDVWILQVTDNVTMRNDLNIVLAGGAQAKNIFWQIGGTVSIGANSHFEGIILAMNGISMNSGASLNGRVFTRAGAIFNANTITEPQ